MYRQYKPAHSDFIIHWTGKDIDEKYEKNWHERHASTTSPEATKEYLIWLKSILKYGLWMTFDRNDQCIINKETSFLRPPVARTCFTELKLSEARNHAYRFGRLGIGFKRFFLFDRLGAPMLYYIPYRHNWLIPPLYKNNCYSNFDYFSCFLKQMTMMSSDKTLEYRYFDEAEWRIIYSEEIKVYLESVGLSQYNRHFIARESIKNNEFKEYLDKIPKEKWPEYLIPIKEDSWFAMIIYPSLSVKIESEADNEIRSLLSQMKPTKSAEIGFRKLAGAEKYSKPIEIDLDTCRNF
jgi:hypothetical protein